MMLPCRFRRLPCLSLFRHFHAAATSYAMPLRHCRAERFDSCYYMPPCLPHATSAARLRDLRDARRCVRSAL